MNENVVKLLKSAMWDPATCRKAAVSVKNGQVPKPGFVPE